MKPLYAIIAFLLITLPGGGANAQGSIVSKGKTDYTIVLSENATSVEQFAASELQAYLEQMGGVTLPIAKLESLSESNASPGIYIGEQLVRQQNIAVPTDQLGGDGFIIESRGKNLYLAGLKQRGTLYAVYDLLERLGCRWFAPDFTFYEPAHGEFVPHLKKISLPDDLHVIAKPDLKYRKKYVEEGWTHTAQNMTKLIDWMAKNKMNVFVHPVNYQNWGYTVWDSVRTQLIPQLQKRGLVVEIGGHGYQSYLPPSKYFDEHPDWFGMKNGKRSRDEHVVFNTSHEAALSALGKNIIDYLKQHPEIDIFDLWPPDGAQWSKDPKSLAQGTPSDRQAIVLNYISKKIKKNIPDLTVEFIAYTTYLDPPPQEQLTGNNILMDYCPIRRSYAYPIWDHRYPKNAMYDNTLKKWLNRDAFTGETSIYSYYRKYAWRSLPIVFPRLIAREIQNYHSLGVVGMGSYSEPGDWFTYELNHYIIAKSSWNSQSDVDSLISDYADHRYKSASKPMQRYIWLIEQTTRKANRIPHTEVTDLAQLNHYADNLQTAADLLDSALANAAEPSVTSLLEKQKLTLKYAQLDLKIRILNIENSSSPSDTRVQKLEESFQAMKKLFNGNLDKGIFISRNNRYY